MFKKGQKKGFTIIELIVVMAVLAILVAMGAPRFLGYTKDAKATAMATDAGVIESAVMQYALQNDDAYPESTALVAADIETNATEAIEIELEALGAADGAADLTALIGAGDVVNIDATGVAPFIRSTANDLDSYFMITSGTLEGSVFAKTAQEKSDGSFVTGKLGI